MVPSNIPIHTYHREIQTGERSSLALLAGLIPPHAKVLDLGCGTGALGHHIRQRDPHATFDGLTLSEEEAALAQPSYRRVVVADLESADLATLFGGHRYQCIVCADVLEHLKNPERVLAACQGLLSDDGVLLISVPNAAYCGLIAELMEGEFRYRAEGLLDQTHLRFFTRTSLQRFLTDNGWHIAATEVVHRETHESEFAARFERLPPSVVTYLMTQPDALTYQHIVVAVPWARAIGLTAVTSSGTTGTGSQALPAAAPTFAIEVYAGNPAGYNESRKWRAVGLVGHEKQNIEIVIRLPVGCDRLRLDPSDRTGYLHLHSIWLTNTAGDTVWQWRADDPDWADLLHPPSDGIFWQKNAAGGCLLGLLHTPDPWFQLPISADALISREGQDLRLHVCMGWPMSADYMALVNHLNTHVAQQQRVMRTEISRLNNELEAVRTRLQSVEPHRELLLLENSSLEAKIVQREAELAGLQAHLLAIENSTVFRWTRPLVNAKIWLMGEKESRIVPPPATARSAAIAPPQPGEVHPGVVVIVPVYRGLTDTRRCIESALRAPNELNWRLLVINDASPEPELTQWLRDLAQQPHFQARGELLENESNLGFVATVNRGMTHAGDRDVILLNSDTEVAHDWIDRLSAAAYSQDRVASVTPFSNNATIFSYPRFCEPNEVPQGHDTASLDRLFSAHLKGQTLEVPTGVGFCMYIRRASLNALGLFDVERFGKGYGEENDFCRRAIKAGWKHLHALDTFVLHAGGVSFGDSKSAREQAAMETLRRLYPDYESAVHHYLGIDPARAARQRIDLARLMQRGLPLVLAVLHNRGGGTQRHARELAAHLEAHASFLFLTPGPASTVLLELPDPAEALQLSFKLPEGLDELVQTLRLIGVQMVHFHHLIGHDAIIQKLPALLECPYVFTAHDHYTYCPQISLTDHSNAYCGEQGLSQCHACLRRSPAPGGADIITWRQRHSAFLMKAQQVLAPSEDIATRLTRFVPGARLDVAPHTDLLGMSLPAPRPPRALRENDTLRVVVIGALSVIKGADLLESVALTAARRGIAVEFHLVGFAYRHLVTQPRSRLTIHGAYEEADLPRLLEWLDPDLAWFPALWPETYSYTLSACLTAGLPVVAPNLGAFAERLSERPWTWVRAWNDGPGTWVDFFETLRRDVFAQMSPTAPQVHAPKWSTQQLPSRRETPWDYRLHYLPKPKALPDSDAIWRHFSDDFFDRHRPENTAPKSHPKHQLKKWALHTVVRLRSAPALRSVARRIPSRWQTRLKSWLLR